MLAKNNFPERERRQAPKRQRFAIKKLTVGVASVLIGFTYLGVAGVAHADVTPRSAQDQVAADKETAQHQAFLASPQHQVAPSQAVAPTAGSQVATTQGSLFTPPAQPVAQVAATPEKATPAPQPQLDQPAPTVTPRATQPALNLAVTEPVPAPAPVTTAAELATQLADANVHTIVLGSNIQVANMGTTKFNQSRQLTIEGNGHSLDFGDQYIDLQDGNPQTPWNLTLQHLTVTTSSKWGTFYFEAGAKDRLTLNGVQAGGKYLVTGSGNTAVNLVLKGDNTLTGAIDSDSAVLYVNSLEVMDGQTTLNGTNLLASDAGSQRAAIYVTGGNVTIDNGAHLTVNADSAQSKSGLVGIRFKNAAGNVAIDQATTGVVRLMPQAQLTMRMGTGAAQAILASDVDVQAGAQLRINTQQSTMGGNAATALGGDLANNSNHMAPISLGTSLALANLTAQENTIRVGKDAVLQIIRTATNSTSPLISYGNTSTNENKHFNLVVNGGTLDLQDAAVTNANKLFWDAKSTPNGNLPEWIANTGMITMWGTGSTDVVAFNNPQLINLQRTGDRAGNFLKLEGMHNDTYVNDPATGTAKALQVDWTDQLAGGNAQWQILAEHNQNQSGDMGPHYFVPKGQQTALTENNSAFGKQLNRSNGSYTLANADGRAGLSYDNGNYQNGTATATGFGANFNWWTPRQIQIKVILYQNDQYQPNLQPNVVDPQAKAVPAANGVKDYTGPDGSKTPMVAGQTPRVTWDHTDPQTGLPLNPLTNQPLDTTTPGVYPDVPATITYPDGSKKQIKETIVVGKIIDVTGKVPTTVPDGYELVTVNATNGHFGTDVKTTMKKYLVKENTSRTDFLAAVAATANNGYDQKTETWSPKLPATFTTADANKNYTVTYYKSPATTPLTTNPGVLPADPATAITNMPKDGAANPTDNLPTGTQVTWKNPIDAQDKINNATPGTTVDVPATVQYPNGQHETITIPVKINQTDADQYQPNGQPITAGPTANLTPEQGIKDFTGPTGTVNLTDLQKNGTVTGVQWVTVNHDGTSTPVATPAGVATTTTGVTTSYRPGTYPNVPIQVTYRDGSTKVIHVAVTITQPIIDVTPRQNTPQQPAPVVPDNYVKVTFNAGAHGQFSDQSTSRTYEVEPGTTAQAVIDQLGLTVTPGYTLSGWQSATKTPLDPSAPITTAGTYTGQYTANQQSVQVIFQAPDGRKVQAETVTGTTGEAVNLKDKTTIPTNWVIDGTDPRGTVTLGTNNQPVIVKVKHGTENVTADPSQEKNVNKTVIRTITDKIPGAATPTVITQTATFHRTATKDLVTNKVTYGEWTGNGQLQSFDVPKIPGYMSLIDGESGQQVPSITVTADSQNQTVSITYAAEQHTLTIQYEDQGQPVGRPYQVQGLTGQQVAVDVANNLPANYQLVKGQTPIDSYTFGPDTPATITYQVMPKTTQTTESKPVTRIINVTKPGATTPTAVEQTETISRTVTKNLVTQKDEYGQWTSATLPEYAIPQVPGYTSLLDGEAATKVPAVTVNGPASQTATVVYTADAESVQVIFKDPAGQVVGKPQVVKGVTGQTVATNTVPLPAGWKIVGTDPRVPVKLGVTNQPIVVPIEHATKDVTNDPSQANEVTKTVTRMITDKIPGAATPTEVVQTATFHRTATEDLVTKQVTYGAWSKDQSWPEYNAPEVTGYTPSPATVAAKDVTADDQNQTVTINYVGNEQTTNIIYQDAQGKVVQTDPVNGRTGETVKVTSQVPVGWVINGNDTVPATITFQPNGTPDVTITVKPATKDVTNDPSQANEVTKTVTRTIIITKPGEKPTEIKQTATFHRTATENLITGGVTYGEWTGDGNLPALEVPQIKGYTSIVAWDPGTEVPAIKVTADTADSEIAVSYSPNRQILTINYVDATTGQVVPVPYPYQVFGSTGSTVDGIDVAAHVPENWQLVAGQTPISSYTFGPEAPKPLEYKVEHATKDVTNEPGQANQVNRTVTRTITVNVPDEKPTVITQTATFHRTATEDLVTKQVTYGAWIPAQKWDAYTPQAVAGYTPSPATVVAKDVTADDQDQAVTINYVLNPVGGTVTIGQGQTPTSEDAKNAIENHAKLPDDTTYTWKQTPDTKTPGTKPGEVVVHQPGQPDQTVGVTVKVTTPDQAKYVPEYQPNVVANGESGIPAANGIANMPDSQAKNKLPDGTKVTWDSTGNEGGFPLDPRTNQPIDTKVPGIYDDVPATITYPDKSTRPVKEQVVVGDVIDVTTVPGHDQPTDPVPDGYVLEVFKVVNGTFGPAAKGADQSATRKLFLVKNDAKVDVLNQLHPVANTGYDQQTGTWDQQVPTTFTQNGTYTITFYKAPVMTPIQTAPGQLPSDPAKGITNMPKDGATTPTDNLPSGTTVEWQDPEEAKKIISNAKPGDQVEIPATVKYLNGQHETINIPVTINQANPDQPGETNPGETKPGTTNPDTKPGDTKPGDQQPGNSNPGDTKPGEGTQPGGQEPGDTKTPGEDTKPDETTPGTQPGDQEPGQKPGEGGQPGGQEPGNNPGEGTQPGQKPGEGTEPGGQEPGNNPGEVTQPGTKPGEGTEPGGQEPGTKPGEGGQSGDQEPGNKPGEGTPTGWPGTRRH